MIKKIALMIETKDKSVDELIEEIQRRLKDKGIALAEDAVKEDSVKNQEEN